MRYINFVNDNGKIETVEAFGDYKKGNKARRYRFDLLKEYQKVSNRYYASQRATKAYYERQKEK